jgi:hypothetical protein
MNHHFGHMAMKPQGGRIMRRVFASTVGCLLVCTLVVSSQDKATLLPQEGYPGEWINVNEKGALFARFTISKKDDALWIEAWQNPDSGKEGSFGKVRLSLLGDNFGAKALPLWVRHLGRQGIDDPYDPTSGQGRAGRGGILDREGQGRIERAHPREVQEEVTGCGRYASS